MFREECAVNMIFSNLNHETQIVFYPQVDSSLICKVSPLQCCKIAALGNKLAIIKGSCYEVLPQLQFQ